MLYQSLYDPPGESSMVYFGTLNAGSSFTLLTNGRGLGVVLGMELFQIYDLRYMYVMAWTKLCPSNLS